MSPPNPARHIPLLIGAEFAITRPVLCFARVWVFPLAGFADAAGDFVGASRDDGAVVVGKGVRGAGDGGEKGVGRVAIPAGISAHGGGVGAPWPDGPDAGVAIFVIAGGAIDVPEVGVIAREGFLDRILTDDGVGVA